MLLPVSTLVVDSLGVDQVCRACVVTVQECNMQADLILLYMLDFDVILGINRLSSLCAVLDCFAKTVILVMPSIPPVVW
uniref:Putative ovule protein n=1 Tax=Solanum chacoense TaxID=4108 RepID=A0A0V0HR00_SOLCH